MEIRDNIMDGVMGSGISITSGGGGARGNVISDIHVTGNGVVNRFARPGGPDGEGIFVSPGGSPSVTEGRVTRKNRISNVIIRDNTVRLGDGSFSYPSARIWIEGGQLATVENAIEGLEISENVVDSGDAIGIKVIAGTKGAARNGVTGLAVRGNRVASDPTRTDPSLRGISLIRGADEGSESNWVDGCLADNLVNGVADDVAVIPDLRGASENVVTTIPCT